MQQFVLINTRSFCEYTEDESKKQTRVKSPSTGFPHQATLQVETIAGRLRSLECTVSVPVVRPECVLPTAHTTYSTVCRSVQCVPMRRMAPPANVYRDLVVPAKASRFLADVFIPPVAVKTPKLDNSIVNRYLSVADEDFVYCVDLDIRRFIERANPKAVLIFPPFNNYRRFLIHKVCASKAFSQHDVVTFSIGVGTERRTVVCFRHQLLQDVKSASTGKRLHPPKWPSLLRKRSLGRIWLSVCADQASVDSRAVTIVWGQFRTYDTITGRGRCLSMCDACLALG
ncbi:hypothetical protein ZHAS_00005473 [Anopheles sinensis]|uniref:R3H domain-containing protein n=1 Tax=Anopheles sinensis TaxID=74873 RepID=A0A084VJM2_ANOSI|nr:hypothetical protein ZHAS_00005473 [Anopheles sinensis]